MDIFNLINNEKYIKVQLAGVQKRQVEVFGFLGGTSVCIPTTCVYIMQNLYYLFYYPFFNLFEAKDEQVDFEKEKYGICSYETSNISTSTSFNCIIQNHYPEFTLDILFLMFITIT